MNVLRCTDHFASPMDVCLGYFMAFPPYTQMHGHEFYEFFVVAAGSILHLDAHNRAEHLLDGRIVFIRPGDVHGYQRAGNDDCYLINAAFHPKQMQRLSKYLGFDPATHPLLCRPEPPNFTLSLGERAHLVGRMELLQLLRGDEQRIAFRGILADIVARYFICEETWADRTPEWITLLCSRMRQKENFLRGIARMQELAGCSPEHLSRSLKRHLRLTPSQFINQLRLNFAGSLLKTTGMPVIDVAYESGYENLAYFNRLFKTKFGVTPLQYRHSSERSLVL